MYSRRTGPKYSVQECSQFNWMTPHMSASLNKAATIKMIPIIVLRVIIVLFEISCFSPKLFALSIAKFQPNSHFHKFLGYSAWYCDE